jgi:ATP-dependent DNA ligase
VAGAVNHELIWPPRHLFISHSTCRGGGVVAKYAEAPYRVGERPLFWLKLRCKQRREFVMGRLEPDFREGIASLLLGT